MSWGPIGAPTDNRTVYVKSLCEDAMTVLGVEVLAVLYVLVHTDSVRTYCGVLLAWHCACVRNCGCWY